jgi:hypothetical protein
MDAHFKFDSVADGTYRLVGQWTIGDATHWLWAPVAVGPGRRVVKDLDNEAAELGRNLHCGVEGSG